MRIEGAVDIDRGADDVFDYLADVRNEVDWHPAAAVRVRKVSDGPIGDGTVFRGDYRQLGSLETTIEEYRRPHHLRLRATGDRMNVVATIAVLGLDDHSSTVRLSGNFEPHGVLRLLLPIAAPMLRRQYRRDIQSLKHVLERQPPS